jgi:hypothetical protein
LGCYLFVQQSPSDAQKFIKNHLEDAKTLAQELGHGVTAEEVLGLSASESTYGNSPVATGDGNYFGLHGEGTDGSRPASKDPSVLLPLYKGANPFLDSGREMVRRLKNYMKPNMGDNPEEFFKIVHEHGWADRSDFVKYMTCRNCRGPYIIIKACM